jgi:hypothetical protein
MDGGSHLSDPNYLVLAVVARRAEQVITIRGGVKADPQDDLSFGCRCFVSPLLEVVDGIRSSSDGAGDQGQERPIWRIADLLVVCLPSSDCAATPDPP